MSNLREKILSLEPEGNVDTKTALVDGVYITSQIARKHALSYVWAKYNMLPDNLTQSLGRLYDAVEEIYLPDKNEKSLFNYTHDKSSVYSRSIAEKNLTVGENNIQASVSETPREAYKAWYNTAYQGKNYYDTLNNYNESFGESINVTYDDDVRTLNSNGDSGYIAIDYENEINLEYAILTSATQSSIESLNRYKKPRKKDFRKDGKINEEAYSEALKKWEDKKNEEGKDFRKNKKYTKNQYVYNFEEQNNFIGEPKTLLTKTSKLFKEKRIDSLVTRTFDLNTDTSFIDTSVDKISGRSRGRNLRKKKEDSLFPFCRAWAAHNQYGKTKNSLIRPFIDEVGNTRDIEQSELIQFFRSENGGEYLHDYSVLKNGFVKITPEKTNSAKYDTKRCMFSIENLAWKDVGLSDALSGDQIGPNGGRIMWFPPYDLQFQESSQVSWNETNFIGRGEPIYTYTNTRRTGTLSFTLLIDHPSIINNFDKRGDKDTSENGDEKDILRFFAGCDIPMKLEDATSESSADDGKEPDDEYIIVPEENSKIKFSIYFPNNYSGHFKNTDSIDDDWAEYLFWGSGTEITGDDTQKRGYEIGNRGITDGIHFSECETKHNDLTTYFYRHDKDLCQNISNKNLKDSKSFNLNNSYTNNDGEKISFAELYTKFNFNKNSVKQYSRKISVLKDDNVFVNPNVDKLDNLGRYKIKILGVGTSQDKPNSQKLAERRAKTVREFLMNNLQGELIFVETSITIETVTNMDVNSIDSKRGRRVDVEISYHIPEIEGNTRLSRMTPEMRKEAIITKTSTAITFNEADYFKNLEYIDNYAYQKIKDKVKYFDPVYHSMSPEGFNSRLTFLQQCTRQGHTLERKTNNILNVTTTAGNMAFGRPPFCVLRIGDFINTKILIRSVNIVYQNGNGMQWDMNPEGIGIQPMFAKITLQIDIIGGQSLDAPISRLNNAVSFNYYANTGVYDNRSDRALYNSSGITYSNLYEPQGID